MRSASDLYVHYGCGLCAPPSWQNFDASPTLRLQRIWLLGPLVAGKFGPVFPPNAEYGDIVKGLPLRPKSCKAIYCSHVLEHLSLTDFRRAIRNTFSYLRPDGVFRCVQPDLRALVAQYHDSQEKDAAITFMRSSHLGRESRVRGLVAFMREWMGNSSHLWMWDWNALSAELCEAGFRNVRRAVAGDSEDPRFNEVEDLERWENSLGVECSR